MLVLHVKPGHAVFVNVPGYREPIAVRVVREHDGQLVLGFDAPREVQIIRDNAKETKPRLAPPPALRCGRIARG